MSAESFVDSSVLLYLLSGDAKRADRVEGLLAQSVTISVQVLNEFAAVATRKLRMPIADVRDVLTTIRAVCRVDSLTVDVHDRALAIAERYQFSLYDSLIVASALLAGAEVLYCEDLQHGQLIDQQLRIVNPFHLR